MSGLTQWFSNFLTLKKITEAVGLPLWMGAAWPGGPETISIAHNDLVDLVAASQLVPGQKYRITDYSTTDLIVHSNPAEYIVGAVEPLIVTASSVNTLDIVATSELYPQDVIHYQLVASSYSVPGLRYVYGRIIYRKDTTRNNIGHFDFRVSKIRLWPHPDTLAFVVASDNGPDPLDFLLMDTDNCSAVFIDADVNMRTPKVCLQGACDKIHIGPQQDLVVFAAGAGDVTIGTCVRVAFHNTAYYCNQSRSSSSSLLTQFLGSVDHVEIQGGNNARLVFSGNLLDCVINSFPRSIYGDSNDIVIAGDHTNESFGNGGLWSVTNTFLTSILVANSLLIPGQKYKISDLANLIVIAETANTYKYDIPLNPPEYADNAAAITGGLGEGRWYRDYSGHLMRVYLAL